MAVTHARLPEHTSAPLCCDARNAVRSHDRTRRKRRREGRNQKTAERRAPAERGEREPHYRSIKHGSSDARGVQKPTARSNRHNMAWRHSDAEADIHVSPPSHSLLQPEKFLAPLSYLALAVLLITLYRLGPRLSRLSRLPLITLYLLVTATPATTSPKSVPPRRCEGA